jgi:capsular exopolysaccharide synthesis family protein
MQEQGLGEVLWRGRWLIVAALVVSVAVAVVTTKLSSRVYQATTLLQVNQSGQVGANASDIFNAQQASQNLAVTYATEIKSSSFLERIRSQVAGGRHSTAGLQSVLSASDVANTGLVSVSAEAGSPAKAQVLAREVAAAFLAVLAQDGQTQANEQQRVFQARIASLSAVISNLSRNAAAGNPGAVAQLDSERRALSTMTQQLGSALAGGSLQGTQVTLVGPPVAGSSPVQPRPVLNIGAGVLLGLLIGFALAWLQVRLDTDLHSGDEAAEILQVPNLASIPQARRPGRADPLQDRGVRDAYDVLQTNLRFSSVQRSLEVISLVSYSSGEGKSSVARGLADATLRSGQNVLLIDGDLRMRTLTETLGFAGAPGVSSVILGDATNAVLEVEPGFFFLPSGPPSPNPVSLLYSHQMRQLIDEMRPHYSLIIIDAPPAAHLADASVLASLSDGVIVVARVGVTKRSQLAATLATNLGSSPTPIIGVVVFEPRTIDLPYGTTPNTPYPTPNTPAERRLTL